MAEQAALDLDQRKHRDDLPVALGEQVMGAMAEHPFHDAPPLDAVEEGRVRAAEHEGVPARVITRLVRAYFYVRNHGKTRS